MMPNLKEPLENVASKIAPFKKQIVISGVVLVVGCGAIGGWYYYETMQQEAERAATSTALYIEEEVVYGDIIVGITESGVAYLQEESVTYDYDMDVTNVQVVTGQFVTAGTVICDVVLTDLDDYQDAYDSELKTLNRQLESAYTSLSVAQANAELDRIAAASDLEDNLQQLEDTAYSNSIDEASWSVDLYDFQVDMAELEEEKADLEAELAEGYDYSDFYDIIEDLDDQIQDILEAMDDLEDDFDDYDDEIDDYEDDIDDLEDDIDDVEDDISALEKQIKNAATDYDTTDWETELESLEAELNSLESQLSSLESQVESLEDSRDDAEDDYDEKIEDYEEDIADLYDDIADAEMDVYEAAQDWYDDLCDEITSVEKQIVSLNNTIDLYNMNLVTDQSSAQSDYNSAVTTAETAQTIYNAEMLSISETLQNCYDDIDDILEEIEDLELDALSETVYAPCDGYVTYVATEDSTISAGGDILTLGLGSDYQIITSISQDDIAEIYVGMVSNVVLDAYDEYTIPAVVESITLTPSSSMSTTVNYVVTLVCDSTDIADLVIYQGMTGDATFVQRQVLDALILSNKTITTVDGVQTVQVLQSSGEIKTVEIETGFSDGFDTEVTSGLEEGDIVILESAVSYASN